MPRKQTSRRDFLTTTAAGASALAAASVLVPNAHAAGDEVIRVGLIGCGGRGTGAAEQCLRAGQTVRLTAVADAFRDRAEGCLRNLRNNAAVRERVTVPNERVFVGLDAYLNVIENCDLVILATPPGFRARQIQAAVNARKHVFTEKPVAVDGPGVRMCLAAFEQANRNRTCVVAGTQRRYQTSYLASMEHIHNGDLGTLVSGRCYWNQGSLWHRARTEQMTDVEWQVRNWLYFTWLSGDHICEQHVHNLDVINWATRSHPTRCMATGGRQVRTQAHFGHIFDHFAVEYEYPNGFFLTSWCRQIPGCANNVSEALAGTRGTWTSQGHRITGERAWSFGRGQDNNPYQEEHNRLIAAIRNNQPINDLRAVSESTLTAIMGRMSAYTGQVVTWEDALNNNENLMPERLAFDLRLPVPAVAMPGQG